MLTLEKEVHLPWYDSVKARHYIALTNVQWDYPTEQQ